MATLSVYSLPHFLFSKFNTDRIAVKESNGVLILKPAKRATDDFSSMRGILTGQNSSVEKHLQRMREDLDLELELER